MNISVMKNQKNSEANGIWQQNAKAAPLGAQGQIIEGTVTKIGERVFLDFGGKEAQFSRESVRDAKIGEIRKYEVMDVSDKGIVLKEIDDGRGRGKSKGIVITKVETDKAAFAEQFNKASGNTGTGLPAQNNIEDAGNRMSEEDYKDLEEEGISLEKYNLERLDKTLSRIKEQRRFKSESIEGQIEKKADYRKQVKRVSESGRFQSPQDQEIANRLLDAGMPATKENVEKISQAMTHAAAAETMSEQSKKYMMANELPPTIENIYHAAHAGSSRQADSSRAGARGYESSQVSYAPGAAAADNAAEKEKAWEEIKPQAEKIIREAGLAVNDESMKQAKWLFDNDLPVTGKMMETVSRLEAAKSNYDPEQLLDEVVRNYAGGMEPEKTALGTKEAVTKETVNKFLKEIEYLYHNLEHSTDIKDITARRQLEEIRLKMTVEAGQRLAGKGIELDTKGLEKVVEGLKELEQDYYQNLLKEADAPDTEQNREVLMDTINKVNALKEAPSYVLGVTFRTRNMQTLESLHQEAHSMKARMDKAERTYETLMTAPRKDMGDSIDRAFENVDSLLKEMNMENTRANQRAVRILGYNSMEITPENVAGIKAYDSQVNAVMAGLHPAVAVHMIKEGINPLDMPIGELNDKIEQMKEEMGITEEEKFSKFLWKLDKEEGLSAEERKAFIGIYRLLNHVEKTKGAAVGSVLQAGKEVTLNHLLEAVRTKKAKGMNKEVDDSFGELKEVSHKTETITEQTAYFAREVSEVKSKFDPKKWDAMAYRGENFEQRLSEFMNLSVDGLNEELDAAEGNPELERAYAAEKLEQIKNMSKTSEGAVKFLSDYSQPVTMENIISAKQMLDGGKSLYQDLLKKENAISAEDKEALSEALEKIEEGLVSREEMTERYGRLEKRISAILDKACESTEITSEDLASLRLMGNTAKLAYSLCGEERYTIPLLTGESITNINLTIVKGGGRDGRLHIGMESEKLGRMEAELAILDSRIKGYVLCDNREGLEAFKGEKENLETAMEGLGLNIGQLDYGMDMRQKGQYSRTESKGRNADTRTLYQAAKAFIQGVRAAEGRN